MSFEETKYQVVLANRALAEVGLASGPMASKGHISMRVPGNPDRFIVKGRGYEEDALPLMQPEDMVVCDLDGNRVEARAGVRQCFEVKIHSCIYRTYPEVQSVVHVHPRFTILMSVLRHRIHVVCHEGPQLVRKPLPVWNHYKIIQSDPEGMEVAELVSDSKAALLFGHGAVTTGSSMGESFMNMYNLEEQAKMNYYLYSAAGPYYPVVPEELLAEPSIPMQDLPHFQGAAQPGEAPMRADGVFIYYNKIAAQKMESGTF